MGLLYDDLLKIGKQCPKPTVRDRNMLKLLKASPIYELTNVIPLVEAMNEAPDVPKRPPHKVMWAEWRWHDQSPVVRESFGTINWTVGALLIGAETYDFKSDFKMVDFTPEEKSIIENKEMVYAVQMFSRLDSSDKPMPQFHRKRIRPDRVSQCGLALYAVYACDFRRVLFAIPTIKPDALDKWTSFLLPVHFPYGYDKSNPLVSPWPMQLCFSLLHCKNVVTEDVTTTSRQKRELSRQNKPIPSRYRIIKLTRPARHSDNDEPAEASKHRFHLVRGHFKDLKHERYKVKGLHWWPEHWRGDEKLGEVQRVAVLKP